MALRDGAIYYSVNLGSGTGAIAIKPGNAEYNDGKWHSVMVQRTGQKVGINSVVIVSDVQATLTRGHPNN